MNFSDEIADKFVGYTVDLADYETHLGQEIQGFFVDLEKNIVNSLEEIDPNSVYQTTHKQKRLNALLEQVRASSNTQFKKIDNHLTEKLFDLAEFDSGNIRNIINSTVGVNLLTTGLNKGVLKNLVGNVMIDGAPQKEWWARQGDYLTTKFADNVRMGMAQGETTDEIVRRITGKRTGRRTSYRTADGALKYRSEYAGGLMQTTRRNAQALVLTSTQSVLQTSRYQMYLANDDVIKGYQALVTLDSRTSDICISRSGMVWKLDGTPTSGNTTPFPGPPPWHWRCRSTLLPILKSYQDISKLSSGKKFDKMEQVKNNKSLQSSMDGLVAGDLTYGQWLKTKPESFQKEVLGVSRWQLWKENKITVKDLVAPSGKTRTLEELRELYDPAKVSAKFDYVKFDLGVGEPAQVKKIFYSHFDRFGTSIKAHSGYSAEDLKVAYVMYSGNAYDSINPYLRGSWPGSSNYGLTQTYVSQLRKDLFKHKLKNNYLVMRNMGEDFLKRHPNLKVGDIIDESSLSSTTLLKLDPAPHKVEIEIPEGYYAKFLDESLSDHPREYELLLPPGKFEVVSMGKVTRLRVVDQYGPDVPDEKLIQSAIEFRAKRRFYDSIDDHTPQLIKQGIEDFEDQNLLDKFGGWNEYIQNGRALSDLKDDLRQKIINRTLKSVSPIYQQVLNDAVNYVSSRADALDKSGKSIIDKIRENVVKSLRTETSPENFRPFTDQVEKATNKLIAKKLDELKADIIAEKKKYAAARAAEEEAAAAAEKAWQAQAAALSKAEKIQKEQARAAAEKSLKEANAAKKKIGDRKLNFVEFGIDVEDLQEGAAFGYLKGDAVSKLEKFEKHFLYQKQLTDAQETPIYHYSGFLYKFINKSMRDGVEINTIPDVPPNLSSEVVKDLNKTLRDNVFSYDYLVKREVGKSIADEISKLKVGEEFDEFGFSSTSLLPLNKTQIAAKNTIQIEIPAGMRGRSIVDISQGDLEAELLLPAGARFRVVSQENGITRVRLVHQFLDKSVDELRALARAGATNKKLSKILVVARKANEEKIQADIKAAIAKIQRKKIETEAAAKKALKEKEDAEKKKRLDAEALERKVKQDLATKKEPFVDFGIRWEHLSEKRNFAPLNRSIKKEDLAGLGLTETPSEIIKKVNDHFKYQRKLIEKESVSVEDYTDFSYAVINSKLRKGKEAWGGNLVEKDAVTKDLKKITSEPLQNSYVVKRSFQKQFFKEHIENLEVGEVIADKGFVSTSLNPLSQKQKIVDKTTVLIELPKGTKGRFLGFDSTHPDELEVLLANGTKFKLVSIEDGVYRFRAIGQIDEVKEKISGVKVSPIEDILAKQKPPSAKAQKLADEYKDSKELDDINGPLRDGTGNFRKCRL